MEKEEERREKEKSKGVRIRDKIFRAQCPFCELHAHIAPPTPLI